MRGVGGPLLCIGDLLSDVGEAADDGSSFHSNPQALFSPLFFFFFLLTQVQKFRPDLTAVVDMDKKPEQLKISSPVKKKRKQPIRLIRTFFVSKTQPNTSPYRHINRENRGRTAMEQKHIILSALSVGVGVGLGLASGQSVSKWGGYTNGSATAGVTAEQIEQELSRLIQNGKDSQVTFEAFPYYLSERTRMLLTSAAYVHLKHLDVSKHTQKLSPASRAILLSGPAELYHQMLAKALSHYFEAKLLMLDVIDFCMKMQSKYGSSKKETPFKKSISDLAFGRMSSLVFRLN